MRVTSRLKKQWGGSAGRRLKALRYLSVVSEVVLVLGETDASETVRNSVPLLSRNRAITTGSSRFEYKFLPAIGLFHGKLLDLKTRKAIQFRGAIVQERDLGTGYCLSAAQSAYVRLEPIP